MSLATWKAIYYPQPANTVTKEKAVSACILKWQGLLEHNLEAHKVTTGVPIGIISSRRVVDGLNSNEHMFINSDNCALCIHYYNEGLADNDNEGLADNEGLVDECESCPIKLATGTPCDRDGTSSPSPYHTWINTGNPVPMLEVLQKAKLYEIEQWDKDNPKPVEPAPLYTTAQLREIAQVNNADSPTVKALTFAVDEIERLTALLEE